MGLFVTMKTYSLKVYVFDKEHPTHPFHQPYDEFQPKAHLAVIVVEAVLLGDGDAEAVALPVPETVNVPLGLGVQLPVDVWVPLADRLHVLVGVGVTLRWEEEWR